MSIENQLIKAKNNLENSRKAIVYKGGSVGDVASFDNLASEIDSIPAGDDKYVLVDDSETAYRKEILPGASELVKVKKIGGATKHINLVPLDNINNASNKDYANGTCEYSNAMPYEGEAYFTTIELEAGIYSYAIFGDFGSCPLDKSTGTFTMTEKGVKRIWLKSTPALEHSEYLRCKNLKIMCWKGSTPPTEADFVPFGVLENVKVTELRSEGANLFDIDAEHTTETAFYKYSYVLEPNAKYTISSDVPQTDPATIYANGTSTLYNGVYKDNPKTVTTDANGNMYILVRHTKSGETSADFDLYSALRNGNYYIQVERGETATEYKPYSAEPIDTFVVPDVELNGINENVYDYVDFEQNAILKRVGMVDLGTLNWTRENRTGTIKQRFCAKLPSDAVQNAITNINCLCGRYITSKEPITTGNVDKTIAVYNGNVYVLDSDTKYTTSALFKADMAGVIFYYELATFTPTPALLPNDTFIKVQAGGSIVAVNDKEEAVPTNISYIRRKP
jgi:hypothetical protein